MRDVISVLGYPAYESLEDLCMMFLADEVVPDSILGALGDINLSVDINSLVQVSMLSNQCSLADQDLKRFEDWFNLCENDAEFSDYY